MKKKIIMKLTKENIHIDLRGKSKDELTDLYWLLKKNNEEILNDVLHLFIRCYLDLKNKDYKFHFYSDCWSCACSSACNSKTEVTIEQLKEILQPMGIFTPIAMKCTQEQFDAIKPKLKEVEIESISPFSECPYLVNNSGDSRWIIISNVHPNFKGNWNREVHEKWNEEIFLKACGIEVETLQEKALRLENELKSVKQQIEEKNNIKIGDWVKRTYNGIELFKADDTHDYRYINSEKRVYQKITNPELIKLIEDETNENNLFR